MIAQSRPRPRPGPRRLVPLLLTITLLSLLYLTTTNKPAWNSPPDLHLQLSPQAPHITKVSMLYGQRNTLYERALQTHQRHAERWGHGMEVLQHDISVGYWNKPAYLLALVIERLAETDGEGGWLVWVDADSLILNPSIPLELFLPPPELQGIHILATKDHKGLNTGIFFLRIHKWTVSFLIAALAYPLYNPQVDLDVQVDQSAMEKVLTGSGYRENVAYLPRPWMNAYEWSHAFEGERGSLLVHFPGLGAERWVHMERWLGVVENDPSEWEVDVEETWYPEATKKFWDRIIDARGVIGQFEESQKQKQQQKQKTAGEEMEKAMDALKTTLYETPFEGDLLQQRIDECKVAFSQL